MDKHIDNDKVIEIDYDKLLEFDLLEADSFSQKTNTINETTQKDEEKIQVDFDELDAFANLIIDEFSITLDKEQPEKTNNQNDSIKKDFDTILESLISNNTPKEAQGINDTLESHTETIENETLEQEYDYKDIFKNEIENTIESEIVPQNENFITDFQPKVFWGRFS